MGVGRVVLLRRRRGSRIESLWGAIRAAIRAQWLRQVLWLWLALRRLATWLFLRVRLSIGHWSGLRLRISIDGLAHRWWGALHVVGRLSGHGGSTGIARRRDGLRGHGLRASRRRSGAKDV